MPPLELCSRSPQHPHTPSLAAITRTHHHQRSEISSLTRQPTKDLSIPYHHPISTCINHTDTSASSQCNASTLAILPRQPASPTTHCSAHPNQPHVMPWISLFNLVHNIYACVVAPSASIQDLGGLLRITPKPAHGPLLDAARQETGVLTHHVPTCRHYAPCVSSPTALHLTACSTH